MDQKPEVMSQLAKTSWRNNDRLHAIAALMVSTANYTAGTGDGFYLFDLQGDPTIVSKISAATMINIDPAGRGDFEVSSHNMTTYPLLRACLHWKRKDGKFQTQENLLDITWIDAQRFFDSLLSKGKLVVHAVDSAAPNPRFSVRMTFDSQRKLIYRKELMKAATCYKQLPESGRDYRFAVQQFWDANPM